MFVRKILLAALSTLPLVCPAAEAPQVDRGRAVYQTVCIACHAPENVMVSAPKAGDVAEWARRAARPPGGLEMLINHAVDGFGAMPPKGGRDGLTRAQLRDAIKFMRAASPTVAPLRDEVR
jgi:cytochrome c5